MLDGMSDSIQRTRIKNLHSREVDRQSPTGLIFIIDITTTTITTTTSTTPTTTTTTTTTTITTTTTNTTINTNTNTTLSLLGLLHSFTALWVSQLKVDELRPLD